MSLKYSDSEADFWKEVFVHLQHRNMVRTNAQPLRLANCKSEFDAFIASHPDSKITTEYYPSYATFEVILTSNIKLRLFIQNNIKGSLMQKNGSDFVKLCDAKFPYNPLVEISEFLEKLPSYLHDLDTALESKAHSERRQKLAFEFIKAYADKKLVQAHSLSPKEDGSFLLSFPADAKTITLTESDFKEVIDNYSRS